MAFVNRFYPLEPSDKKRPHSECECSWRMARRGQQVVLQLDTYGSPQRQDGGTVSQSLQLDESTTAQLVAVIRTAFPRIA